MQARKSLLFDKGVSWIKKDCVNMFDVTMGCFDGAEICKLVGHFYTPQTRAIQRKIQTLPQTQ